MSRIVQNPAAFRPVMTAQPQVPVGIDWSNPITRGLALAYTPSIGIESVKQSSPLLSGAAFTTNVSGKALTGSGNWYAKFTDTPASGSFFIGVVFTTSNAATTQLLISRVYEADPWPQNYVLGITANTIYFQSSSDGYASISYPIVANKTYSALGTFDAASKVWNLYLDGRLVATRTGSALPDAASVNQETRISSDNGNAFPIVGSINLAYVGLSCHANNAAARLSSNPWQIFTPITRPYHAIDLVRGPVQTRQSYLLGTTPEAARTVAPAILRKRVMTSQPQYAAQIDWGNPITRGLVSAGIGGQSIEIKTGKLGTQAERAITSKGVSSANLVSGVSFSSSSSPATLFFYGVVPATPSSPGVRLLYADGVVWNSESDNAALGIWVPSFTPNINAAIYNNNNYGLASSAAVPINIPFTAALSWTAGNELLFFNGIQVALGVSSAGHRVANGNCEMGQLANASGSSKSIVSAVFNRALSPQEIKSLSDNPYQIFLAPNAQPWVSP